MNLTLVAGLAGAAAVATLGAGWLAANARAEKFEARDRANAACLAAIGPDARADRRPETLCPPVIAEHWARSVQAAACDQVLTARPESLFAIRASCSTPVKTLLAQRDAAQGEVAALAAELKAERAGRAAAVNRAAADARVQSERKTRRETADARAPRDPSGRVVCGPDCLRERAR